MWIVFNFPGKDLKKITHPSIPSKCNKIVNSYIRKLRILQLRAWHSLHHVLNILASSGPWETFWWSIVWYLCMGTERVRPWINTEIILFNKLEFKHQYSITEYKQIFMSLFSKRNKLRTISVFVNPLNCWTQYYWIPVQSKKWGLNPWFGFFSINLCYFMKITQFNEKKNLIVSNQ